MDINHNQVEKFWLNVQVGDDADCWEWQRGKSAAGYGQMWTGYKVEYAHRIAFYLTWGYDPHECRHSCDNPPCCNPSHLLDGTRLDNVHDSIERGRNSSPQLNVVAGTGKYTVIRDSKSFFVR